MDEVAEPQLPSVDSDSPAEMLSKIPTPFRDWKLDLALKTDNPFLIRGNLGNGEIYLDARLAGTLGSPRPTGHATLREITAQLPFSTLEIPTGRITLRPDAPFDPALEIRGGSKIRPYEVDLYIYGSLSDPRIQTTSNPPLPESEVLTLLATGATSEGVEDPSAASARAAQLLIEEIRRGRIEIVSGLRPLLSVLDKVEFQVGERDPYSNKKFNSASFELSDEWLLTAGFSEEGRTRAKVTYLIRFR
jgi:autotransporter translocation and assembly factor TamB